MFGRRPATATATVAEPTKTNATNVANATATATRPVTPLGGVDQLLRHAEWAGLGDAQRAGLLGQFQSFPDAATVDAAHDAATDAESALQDWVAALVGTSFQPEPAQLIRGWLEESPPAAHFYLGGSPSRGKRSLVAALARQVMATRPTPPEYAYLPVPTAMDQAYLLALPHGTGETFTKAFDQAMRAIAGGWSGKNGDDDSGNSDNSGDGDQNGAQPAAQPAPPPRGQLVAQAFAPLEAVTPESARSYVQQLRAAFEALAVANADLPVSYDDIPTVLVRAPSTPAEQARPGGPVVVSTLLREKLNDVLIRANGGVLILPAPDPLIVDGAWVTLAAALASRSLEFRADWPRLPLDVRVALVGDYAAYDALDSAPGDFDRLFRYEAWCTDAADWTPAGEAAYAALVDGVARRHGLPGFDPSGVARMVEEGARRSGGLNRTHLSTDLLLLHDLGVEAGKLAKARGAALTTGDDVDAALRRRRTLHGVVARRVREAILSGQSITPTAGAAIGQINGLGIYEFHPVEGSFAVPTRISATVSPGRDERLLDIEREAEQADADHVRGEMTVEGYLAQQYGATRPVNLVARIRFEQEHGTTGGDSASGAMLYAVLSALAQVPLRYSYAVTGAVGQYGELQPIGGVNTKIEGFWELCRQRRAQGEQAEGGYGVLIPAVNARDLMLRPEVADAIAREGWFRIWPVSTVDQAMEILTGLPAAELHARVDKRLQRFHEFGAGDRAR